MCCGGVVNEAGLPGLTLATVIFVWAASAGMNQWEGSPLLFLIPSAADSARRQSIQTSRKVFIWSGEKGLNPRNWTKGTQRWLSFSPSVPPFFLGFLEGGNTLWAAYLCCCVPTLCCAPPLRETTQHARKGHAGMPIMHCGNCDCFWFKWFQMRLLEVHSEKQLVAVETICSEERCCRSV